MHASDFKKVGTIFRKMKPGTNEEMPPTATVMTDHYFNEEFIDMIVNSSNAYAFERRRREPSLAIWKMKKASQQITAGDINHFLALLFYFGIVKLPSKRDYWSKNHHWMPSHPICSVNGMTRDRFAFLWRHFHCNCTTDDDFKSSDNETEDESEEDQLVDMHIERVQREQEVQIADDEDLNLEEDSPDSEESKVWYEKVKPLVDHMSDKSQELVYVLGTFLAVDEMMIRFMGRSRETHRMKNKPIKEGFKFFVLAITTGFVLNFSPDGRTAAKSKESNKMDYDTNSEYGKIGSMVLYLVNSILALKEKQVSRFIKSKKKRATRAVMKLANEKKNENVNYVNTKFIIAMDNYFTRPKVIAALRDLGIGIVGTAKYQHGCPPV